MSQTAARMAKARESNSYSAYQVIEATGLSRGMIQGWRRNGFFQPENAPNYTTNDIEAVRRIKVLRIDHGAPVLALQAVGRSLCERRGYASNAEAFLKTDLVWRDGDIQPEHVEGSGFIKGGKDPGTRVSHSHITRTSQPISASRARAWRSRSTLRASLGSQ